MFSTYIDVFFCYCLGNMHEKEERMCTIKMLMAGVMRVRKPQDIRDICQIYVLFLER